MAKYFHELFISVWKKPVRLLHMIFSLGENGVDFTRRITPKVDFFTGEYLHSVTFITLLWRAGQVTGPPTPIPTNDWKISSYFQGSLWLPIVTVTLVQIPIFHLFCSSSKSDIKISTLFYLKKCWEIVNIFFEIVQSRRVDYVSDVL